MSDPTAIIGKLHEYLGKDAVLLPIDLGKKGPLFDGWQHLTPEDCKNNATLTFSRKNKLTEARETYRESRYGDELAKVVERGGNIGVLLRDNLCAIDLDDDDDVEPFLCANPQLRSTLITKGRRGVQIWIRAIEEAGWHNAGMRSFPQMIKLKRSVDGKKSKSYGEWRAQVEKGAQSIVWGVHPEGMRYQFINEAPAAALRFKEIVWPEGTETPWEADNFLALCEHAGHPWEVGEEGELKQPCESFWSTYIAHHMDILFEPHENRFYMYSQRTGAWHYQSDHRVRHYISLEMGRLSTSAWLAELVYGGGPRSWQRLAPGQLSRLTHNIFCSFTRLSAFANLVKGVGERRGIFTTGGGVIHLLNGMMDLKSDDMKLEPFSPYYYSRNQIPLAYDPDATCPTFLNDLMRTALPEDDVSLMQRFTGLAVLGRNTAQKIMLLVGTPGGGKSTLVKVIQSCVGDPNVTHLRTQHLGSRFELFAFVGKTLLCGVDVPGNFLMTPGAQELKGLTGGDRMEGEVKGGSERVPIVGDFNVIITSNSRLRVKLDSDAQAWRRRLCLVRYDRPPTQSPREDFAYWLVENEGSGILNWIIEGARQVLRGDRLKLTERQQTCVDDLLDESDSIRVFLRRRIVAAKGECLLSEDIAESYFEFCEDAGWDAQSKRIVERTLPDLMLEMFRAKASSSIEDEDGKNRKGYRGVAFAKEPTPDDAVEKMPF